MSAKGKLLRPESRVSINEEEDSYTVSITIPGAWLDMDGTSFHAEMDQALGVKLTAAKRKKIPAGEFGMPGQRKYPMPDRSHAANAKARASQQVKKGNLSAGAAAKINAKANRVLGKKK